MLIAISKLEIAMAKAKIKSIAELSRRTGINRISLSSYCGTDINSATVKNLLKICNVLDCTLEDILEVEEQ